LKKAGAQIMPWMQSNQSIEYNLKMVKITSKQAAEQERTAHEDAQKGKDDMILKDYFAKGSIVATRTPSGLYYQITKPGSGANPVAGQEVTVNYTGMTIDGTKFDSNIDSTFQHVSPFKFVLGQGQVIRGWDEGVALMNKGSKGRLFIPSHLAYGSNPPSPQIPKDGILIFDVEVVGIATPAKAPQQTATIPAQ
jgi:FKBP-type peptidyl-prolyl cis-trans isomerase